MVQLPQGAGPLMLKCQCQPTSAQGKPQMGSIALPGMSARCYDDNLGAIGATSHHRVRKWLEIWNPHRDTTDSALSLIQPRATSQVSFPSAKLEQYTCNSDPLNLIYKLGSILPSYSQGIPCNSFPGNIYFPIPHVCFLSLISQRN